MEYDEYQAIKLMRNAVSPENAKLYTDDELLNVIDMIWDYYEENGMLDIDLSDDDDEEEDILSDLSDYVRRMLKKDKGAHINPDDVQALVAAELKYEDSII